MPTTDRQEMMKDRIGEEVRVARARLGISQDQLAKRANLSPTYVSEIENGHRDPSASTLVALSEALGVDPNTILGADGRFTDARYGS